MSHRAVQAAGLGATAAAGLGVAVLVSPAGPALTLAIALYVVGAVAVAVALLAITRALPHAEPARRRQPPRPEGVGQLESIARALQLAESSSFDLHTVLRPIVREVAAARLARRGVSLDRQPERARALLGEPTWELVRLDREAPVGRSGLAGSSRDDLRALVESLEAV